MASSSCPTHPQSHAWVAQTACLGLLVAGFAANGDSAPGMRRWLLKAPRLMVSASPVRADGSSYSRAFRRASEVVGCDASRWTHPDGLKRPHPKSDTESTRFCS
jgi:hypothetical protein